MAKMQERRIFWAIRYPVRMSFSETVKRVAVLASELWQHQSAWILLTAGLYGFSYLFSYDAGNAILLLASVMQMALYVYWLKVGARSGFSANSFAETELNWLSNVGVSLGIGLPFAIVFGLSAALLPFGSLGWLLVGLVWFVVLIFLELYSSPVAVRARGFREALAMTIGLLSELKNRQALTTSAFWYPVLLGLGVSFLQMFVNPDGGLAAAILGFALAAFQLAWNAAAQLVLYENVWARVKNRQGALDGEI